MSSGVENVSVYVFVGAPAGPDFRRSPGGPWEREEDWHITMSQMRAQVDDFLRCAPCGDICEKIFSAKWRLAMRLFDGSRKWSEVLLQLDAGSGRRRRRRRPPTQWTTDLNAFCSQTRYDSFLDALLDPEMEAEYIHYCNTKYCKVICLDEHLA